MDHFPFLFPFQKIFPLLSAGKNTEVESMTESFVATGQKGNPLRKRATWSITWPIIRTLMSATDDRSFHDLLHRALFEYILSLKLMKANICLAMRRKYKSVGKVYNYLIEYQQFKKMKFNTNFNFSTSLIKGNTQMIVRQC